jgi:ribosomal protein RSM22 (predicted rRNA methylase)
MCELLWNKVKVGGMLVFAEPGTPKGFRFIHDFRSYVINKNNGIILSPCSHMGKCPMADRLEWCHFETTYKNYTRKEISSTNMRNVYKEKFGYIVFEKTQEMERE